MDAVVETAAREKVGVIVIHGVGETNEGWIDSHLVPQLETYKAYANAGPDGLTRRPETSLLLLTARTLDDEHIAIGLEDDADFRNFCRIVLVEEKADDPAFATAAARRVNRDALWSQARRVIDEKKTEVWLRELGEANVPCCLAFDPSSEVYRVRDPESSDQGSTWASFNRRCRLPDRDIVVSELYWADMSKIGYTNISRSSAIVQLFLESPFVLGETLLKGSERGIHSVIAALVHISNWLMRWPIAGLTLPVFLTAFAVIAVQQVFPALPEERLPATVATILGVISVISFAFFRQTAHRKVGLADLSLSTALCAFLLILVVAAYAFALPDAALKSPENYLLFGFLLLMASWFVWTVTTVLAAALVTLVFLKRLVLPAGRRPPLSRASLAISLNLLLGMVWKLILPLVGVLTINTLFASSFGPENTCKLPMPSGVLSEAARQASTTCQLSWVKTYLLTVSLLNAGAIIAVAAVVLVIMSVRGSMARVLSMNMSRSIAEKIALPRLITSPWIVATLFAVACFNAAFAFTPGQHLSIPARLDGGLGVGTSVLGLLAIFFLLQRLIEVSNSYVHIGRDLVDHQYGASYRPLTAWLLPPEEDAAEPLTAETFRKFRRRRRIQRRLEALIDEVVAQQKIDRLIFLAHSQGTVIMYDYLDNHDNLVAKSHADRQSLFDVQRIDVVTIGSPLTHLYRYYFADYESKAQNGRPATLMRRVSTWTNMWRIDDPIGAEVDFVDGIENRRLGRGGHMDYWRQAEVCGRVWELACKPPVPAIAQQA